MSERLTYRDRKGDVWIKDSAHVDEQGQICMLSDRLAAYEDSGLSPEQVQELADGKVIYESYEGSKLDKADQYIESLEKDLEQYNELAKAKAEGRLVVLPCKVGDTVYVAVKEWDARYCLKSSFAPCVRVGVVAHICITYKGIIVCVTVNNEYSEYFEFGETVFLSREEAEKALDGGIEK